jgi:hypothetical protein
MGYSPHTVPPAMRDFFHTNCGKRCEQAHYSHTKPLISISIPGQAQFLGIQELCTRPRRAAAWVIVASGRARASAQILWKRLCARPPGNDNALEFKRHFCRADFLGTVANRPERPSVHINCGKRCEQELRLRAKCLIALLKHIQAEYFSTG